MNSFMAEIETLFDEEQDEIPNLLVVGIVERPSFGIPEGILRHGRFGKHIEIPLPSGKERKEIFDIYLSDLIERKQLDDSVTVESLLRLTEDRSGAYIEGLVNIAFIQAMRRYAAVGPQPPLPILKIADFEQAAREIQTEQKWKTYVI
jgi:SpoVK/Ycf46/Vps4 family AAA+-type ATPase